ncbi:hypothetical protein MIND_01300700 [Mycena indigotica]|uniref:F-box domain-containing protein n=1 Tax=Mycena indigotica TaxID=2126181 RepID=A0A8H6S3F5_9AGAR|nr:uncharacterized protein MIND_01300700 [Mycena indigotica]KAF7290605.1 hypothetical protein MIND_01300700 [Mycena indigotica]
MFTVYDLDDLNVLPFSDVELSLELPPQRQWDSSAVNYVAIHCWKEHRSKQQSASLSLLPQTNLDVMFEVFGHLHPFDLVHLSRVNKTFRQLLLCPTSDVVWRNVFRVGVLPPCPPQVSGRRWAKLLFGRQLCDECMTPNTLPDFILCRRLCTECMNKCLSNEMSTHLINDLLLKTNVGRFWPSEAEAVAMDYERLREADQRKPDGYDSLLEPFVERRKKFLRDREEAANTAVEWTQEITGLHRTIAAKQHRRVVARVGKHLLREGYKQADIAELDEYAELEMIQVLTPKRWRRIRPIIIPHVENLRVLRLERERKDLITARTSVALTAVSKVFRTAPAQCWAYFPPNYTLETFTPLQELLHNPSTNPLTPDDPRLVDSLLELPAFVAAWRQEKRELLASVLPPPSSSQCPTGVERLELATSVFTCKGSWISNTSVAAGRALIGWDGAGAHLRCQSLQRFWDHRVHYAEDGAAAVRELVTLVGLDPETTTAREMDTICGTGSPVSARMLNESEKRFVCAICPLETSKGITGRRAMRWRECVLHTIERIRLQQDPAHQATPPAWMLLTDKAMQDVYRRESPDPFVNDSAWICALCPEHYKYRTTRKWVLDHLKKTHSIRRPVEQTHYLYYAGLERTSRPYELVSQAPPQEDGSVNVLHANLRSRHVIDKHGIAEPSEAGGDWSTVELILRATPMI